MDNAQSLIQAYNMGFYICIAVGFLALAGAVAMFFLFDIRTNFLLRTNRAQQISVKKTKEKNEKTDPLAKQQVNMDFTTDDLNSAGTADPQLVETSLLAEKERAKAGRTIRKAGSANTGNFRVIEETIVIHTDEII